MSSSTALLPSVSHKKNDHPIFLRACHSPWLSVSQKSLVRFRGALAAYFLISSLVILHYELEISKNGWLVVYNLSNIVYGLQTLPGPSCISTTRIATTIIVQQSLPLLESASRHLARPPTPTKSTFSASFIGASLLSLMSLPSSTGQSSFHGMKHRFQVTKFFGDKLTTFFVFSKYGFNSVLALIELFILSSIKRSDVACLEPCFCSCCTFSRLCWLGSYWQALCGKYTYFFLDHEKNGWEYYWASVAAFVVLVELFFVFVYSLTGVRESMTKKQNDDKNTGYQRLPQ
ncbi:hypothetical protein H4I96_11392 [Botrytis cinerea]